MEGLSENLRFINHKHFKAETPISLTRLVDDYGPLLYSRFWNTYQVEFLFSMSKK